VTGTEEERPTYKTAVRIVLVGFMGAGKTTVGRLLAQKLDWTFVDLDDEIVNSQGQTIAQIFEQSGEPGFRAIERSTLQSLITSLDAPEHDRVLSWRGKAGIVLGIGGGAFVQPGNAALLREHGFSSAFLDASVDELRQRCADSGASRPLHRDENLFRQLYEARRGGYMAADLRVDTGGKTPEQVVDELLGFRLS
jgi:shikimate kinase